MARLSPLSEVCPQEANHHGTPPEDWRVRSLHRASEIVPVIDEVVDGLDAVGFSGEETLAVRLALEEALVNAIKHGHRGDPDKEVRFRYRLTPQYILAEIEDEGPGFRPEEVPDPFAPENLVPSDGRGMFLMHSYMTWVRHNRTGNCVTMCRLRSGPE
jgi:serine/threonine-protein kinase RsbW